MDVAVDVRMAVYQFVAERIGHIGIVEKALFLTQLGVENHMQQQVAQLLLDSLHVAVGNGVGQFVGLLDGVAAQRLEGLFAVPRTFAAQGVHHLQKPRRGRKPFILFHKI